MLLQVKSNCAILAPLCNVCASIGGSPWAVFTTPAPQYHVMLQRCYNVCPFLVNKSIGRGQSVFVAIAWWFRNHKISGQMAPERRYWLLHQASWISTQSDSLFPLFNFKKWFLSCKQPFGGPNFFAVETPVVLIVHRAGAAARLRPVRCLERGEEINNQWPELRQQQQPHTAADLSVVSAQSSQHCLLYWYKYL